MTQIESAKSGKTTQEVERIAHDEGLSPEVIRDGVATGKIIVPKNRVRNIRCPCGIGEGLRIKVNANLGTSPETTSLELELEKLKVAVEAGADSVMDLSIGGDLDQIRREVLKRSPVPVGTVPIYQAAVEAVQNTGSIMGMTRESIIACIRRHIQDGVDFITIHSGITQETIKRLKAQGRVMDVVSRGGAFLVEWMVYHGRENPLYEGFDEVLKIAKEFDVTLSLGDGLRPGSVVDATDRSQVQELITLGELRKAAFDEDVQVMIEGPGHVSIDQIETNIILEKRLCQGAPFYVLGPLVTDVTPGYDHISSSIGGAMAGYFGADFLCYVTPGEHLRLPTPEDVHQGVVATRIAAHAADLARRNTKAWTWDREMSIARRELNWGKQLHLALDKRGVENDLLRLKKEGKKPCSMCGEYCAIKTIKKALS